MSAIAEAKAQLRREVRAKQKAMPPLQRQEEYARLMAQFQALPSVARAKRLFLFWGVGYEPDTGPLVQSLLSQGKEVALPRCLDGGEMEARAIAHPDDLEPGVLGIPAPKLHCPLWQPEEIDLILVPNLCCDRQGYRLGQGGGYYDRYLPRFSGETVALCLPSLLQPALPLEPWDRRVGLVLV